MATATDASGYNTDSSYLGTNWNPTNAALVNGMQSAATYDPSQQSTSSPTSAFQYLAGGLQSQNKTAQNAASQNQGAAGTTGSTMAAYATPAAATVAGPTAATFGLTAASNNAPNATYAASMPSTSTASTTTATPQFSLPQGLTNMGASSAAAATPTGPTVTSPAGTTYSVSTAAPGASAVTAANTGNAIAANQAATNSLTQYGGPQLVNNNGQIFQWNSATGSYESLGTMQSSGLIQPSATVFTAQQAANAGITWNAGVNAQGLRTGKTSDGQLVTSTPNGTVYTQGSPYALSSAQQAAMQTANVPNGTLGYAQDNGVSQINQAYGSNIAAWQKANAAAAASNAATAATNTQANAQQQAIDYMTTHNGALPPGSGTTIYSGGNGAAQAAGIAAAQQAYQAQQAHAALLAGITIAPVNTSAVDATDQEAINSVNSQYASQGISAGGLASRMGANAAQGVAAQNVLNHQTAAAASYDNNLSTFSNALTAQYGYDQSATGNQLYSDIQGVQQIAAQLQQEMGQLSTTSRTQAQGELDNLNQLIFNYQNAVHMFGQGSSNAMTIARNILSASGSVAASVT